MLGFLKDRRRRELRERPLPEAWRAIIDANLPTLKRLPPEDRRELEGHAQVFLAEKSFEGCGGLEMTDEIRVTIAAEACLLLLHRETDYYPGLDSILVYPSAYVADARRVQAGLVSESRDVRLGESWHRGAVVLAWDAVLHGAADPRDGHDVVLHEFAHQLDTEDGSPNGAPPLPKRAMYASWARVLNAEFESLSESAERHRRTVLDKYGATNPAEFFAVVTEAFFEKPLQLEKRHPELYEQLATFYRQDPARWTAA